MFKKSTVAAGVAGLMAAVSAGAQTPTPAQVAATRDFEPPPPIPVPPVPPSGPDIATIAVAAQSGASRYEARLGEFYHYGIGLPKDRVLAAVWLRKAARHGNFDAMTALARLYGEGPDAPKPEAGEPDWLQMAADGGWREAQVKLGRMYAEGDGRPKDLVTGYKWLTLAIDPKLDRVSGNSTLKWRTLYAAGMTAAQIAEAQRQADQWLAAPATPDQMADRGWEAYSNHQYDTAIAILTPPAMAGNARAQFFLGMVYMEQPGALQGDAVAAGWMQKAAAQGQPGAEHFLGFFYTAAKGVARDPAAAAAWERKAAEQGLAPAEDDLGFMYGKRFGVAADDAAQLMWIRKAAQQGQGRSQYMLGNAYTFGNGAAKDMVQAYKWKYLAALYPSIDKHYATLAKSDLDWMATSMTKDQVDHAIAEAKAWHPVFEVVP